VPQGILRVELFIAYQFSYSLFGRGLHSDAHCPWMFCDRLSSEPCDLHEADEGVMRLDLAPSEALRVACDVPRGWP
jgi:hypothetical protein